MPWPYNASQYRFTVARQAAAEITLSCQSSGRASSPPALSPKHHDSSQTLGQERIPLCPRGQAARAVVALFGCMDVLWNCVYTPTALMASTAPSLSPRLHREAPPQQRKVTCCPNRKPLPCHRRCSIPCHMGGP
ncbi:unnamed protein product, partial [Prorocentrum cordatum]